ncbi:MAG TPA: phosphoglycerate kinase, partial [Dehalococcoidia bacterium]|nr:phosphoglycerate kinase [Dehalococcoidia bacterium]
MGKQTVRDVDVRGKRVLVRVDFNVPLDRATGQIADDTRIREALPTIAYLTEHGAKVILCSHLDRPGGQVVEGLRLAPEARRLEELLGRPVAMATDCVGPEAEAAVQALQPGGILLLENLRFHPEEEQNDPLFAQALARLADIYANDAFGTAHRAHASIAGVAAYLPAVSGLLMEKEIGYLGRVLSNPERPFTAILGGAKVSDKIKVVENLLTKVDSLIIGGGMANSFLKALGLNVGSSKVNEDGPEHARKALDDAQGRGIRILLPTDAVAAEKFEAGAAHATVPLSDVPAAWLVLDIGPETRKQFAEEIKGAKTVVWNGPMGVFEWKAFAGGTKAVAQAMAGSRATTIIGGGETAEAVESLGLADKMTH